MPRNIDGLVYGIQTFPLTTKAVDQKDTHLKRLKMLNCCLGIAVQNATDSSSKKTIDGNS